MNANFISTVKLEIMIGVNVLQTMVVERVRWLKLGWWNGWNHFQMQVESESTPSIDNMCHH